MARRNTQLLSDAVDWIAANDDAECTDAATVAETLTVCLVADVFGRTRDNVAALVVAARRGDTNHHAPDGHLFVERAAGRMILVQCTCGASRQFRRENALARAARVRAWKNAHLSSTH